MYFIPYVREKIKLEMSRADFVKRLVELTEKDYPLIPAFEPLPTDNFKEYSREVYDNSLLLWKTIKPFQRSLFLFTTIYVRIIDEPDDTISIRYRIRYNLMNCILGIFILSGMLYMSMKSEPFFLLYGFGLYAIWLWMFNYLVKDDKQFLKVLTNKLNPWKLI